MRHGKKCQCFTCAHARYIEWLHGLDEKFEASREAMRGGPTKSKPVFVRAFWRKQKGFKRSDPAFRRVMEKET